MSDRVPSDHASVETYRAEVTRSGGTRRPCLRLPDDLAVDAGDFVRVVIDGEEYHARVVEDARGRLLRGAYDNRRLARTPDESAPGDEGSRATNRLVAWLERTDPDASVELDAIDPGYRYGVRLPGTRTVYEQTGRPDESLAAIAERLDDPD